MQDKFGNNIETLPEKFKELPIPKLQFSDSTFEVTRPPGRPQRISPRIVISENSFIHGKFMDSRTNSKEVNLSVELDPKFANLGITGDENIKIIFARRIGTFCETDGETCLRNNNTKYVPTIFNIQQRLQLKTYGNR